MKRWMIVVALGAAAAGCHKKIPWAPKRATELAVGPNKLAIPAGWRDIAELEDAELRAKLPPGVIGMMPEALGEGGFHPNIVFTWAPFQAGAHVPGCQQFSDLIAKQFQAQASKVESLQIEGDPACRWAIAKDAAAGVQAVRFQKDHLLVVQCLRAAQGDAAVDQTCAQVLSALKFPG